MTEKQIYKNGTILRKISPSFLWVKRISYFLLAVLSLVSISCERKNLPDARPEKSIVILSDNDVHCSIDGYTRLAGLSTS